MLCCIHLDKNFNYFASRILFSLYSVTLDYIDYSKSFQFLNSMFEKLLSFEDGKNWRIDFVIF